MSATFAAPLVWILWGILGLTGPFWSLIGSLNDNFTGIGYVIIAIFLVAWLVSALLWRLRFSDAPG